MRLQRRGFTLIEILVVLLILSVLAGFAFARLQTTRDKSVVATMVSDLHAIMQEQEAHYIQMRAYSNDLVELLAVPSPDNTMTIPEATPAGWSAQVVNPRVTKVCTVFVGSAAPLATGAIEGSIDCR